MTGKSTQKPERPLLVPNSPQAQYEVAMIEAYLSEVLEPGAGIDPKSCALAVWRITKEARRPVKDDSWRK